MSGLGNIFFWSAFTAVGVVVEMLIPRIDAFVSGFILLLQERSYKTLLWVMPLFVLLQEGLGTRMFGGSIAWYTVIYLFYRLGERFFTSDSFIFLFYLSAACGAAYYGIYILLAPLQDLFVDTQSLIDVSMLQSIYLPISWSICKYLRREVRTGDE